MGNEQKLLGHKILSLFGEPDAGKTQIAIRLAVFSGKPIVYVDCAHALSERDLACANVQLGYPFVRLRPEHIDEASDMVLRCISEITDGIVIIDPLSALRPVDYEIGGRNGVLRQQMAFVSRLLPIIFTTTTELIIVDHLFRSNTPPVASLFADFSHHVVIEDLGVSRHSV